MLSDLYAQGVAAVDSLLMILAASLDMPEDARSRCTRLMIDGFSAQALRAGCRVSGGQSVLNPWPVIGGTASAVCESSGVLLPLHAVAGDVLLLTKPLGIQVAVNVKQWSRSPQQDKYTRLASLQPAWSRYDTLYAYHAACDSMLQLNRTAASLLHAHHAHASTDVTGFGLLGHAETLVRQQLQSVDFLIDSLPCIRRCMEVSDRFGLRLREGLAAETSGGLLVALSRQDAAAFMADMRRMEGRQCWLVGRVEAGSREVRMSGALRVEEV